MLIMLAVSLFYSETINEVECQQTVKSLFSVFSASLKKRQKATNVPGFASRG